MLKMLKMLIALTIHILESSLWEQVKVITVHSAVIKNTELIYIAVSTEDAIRNQYEFFVQRFGGPPLYSQRKGQPALKMRHARFQVTTKAADRWIHHMNNAVADAGVSEKHHEMLMEFFSDVAYFLRNSV